MTCEITRNRKLWELLMLDVWTNTCNWLWRENNFKSKIYRIFYSVTWR